MHTLVLLVVSTALLVDAYGNASELEQRAREWIDWYMEEAVELHYDWYKAYWQYQTNYTEENMELQSKARTAVSKLQAGVAINASQFDSVNLDELHQRVFKYIRLGKGRGVLTSREVDQLNQVSAKMMRAHSGARVRDRNCNMTSDCLMDGIKVRTAMNTLNDSDELASLWKEWIDAAAKGVREFYPEMVRLRNLQSRARGFDSRAEELLFYYEADDFEEQCEELWNQVLPLYRKLQNYVRHQLMKKYPEELFPSSGHLPVHLLGGSMGAYWQPLFDDIKPFNNKSRVSFGGELLAQGYTPRRIYELGEAFFISLGYSHLPQSFWNYSLFEKPDDGREVMCGASSWDFMLNGEVRIKHCAKADELSFMTAHHELGHIYYFKAYEHLPYLLRQGANPGFHEAIGDTISLSSETPHYLSQVGLIEESYDPEADINYLLRQALHKLVLMPFAYLVDKWRYGVFRGEITPNEYNSQWWSLRCKYQGVYPPVPRSEEDFDPAELRHITTSTPYLRYFVSLFLQFQFHEVLCKEAGYDGPLHLCDIYGSKEAGTKLWSLMELGASKPWQEVLYQFAGTRKMDAKPVLEYFKPLSDWLDENNYGNTTWDDACPEGSIVFSDSCLHHIHYALVLCILLTALILP